MKGFRHNNLVTTCQNSISKLNSLLTTEARPSKTNRRYDKQHYSVSIDFNRQQVPDYMMIAPEKNDLMKQFYQKDAAKVDRNRHSATAKKKPAEKSMIEFKDHLKYYNDTTVRRHTEVQDGSKSYSRDLLSQVMEKRQRLTLALMETDRQIEQLNKVCLSRGSSPGRGSPIDRGSSSRHTPVMKSQFTEERMPPSSSVHRRTNSSTKVQTSTEKTERSQSGERIRQRPKSQDFSSGSTKKKLIQDVLNRKNVKKLSTVVSELNRRASMESELSDEEVCLKSNLEEIIKLAQDLRSKDAVEMEEDKRRLSPKEKLVNTSNTVSQPKIKVNVKPAQNTSVSHNLKQNSTASIYKRTAQKKIEPVLTKRRPPQEASLSLTKSSSIPQRTEVNSSLETEGSCLTILSMTSPLKTVDSASLRKKALEVIVENSFHQQIYDDDGGVSFRVPAIHRGSGQEPVKKESSVERNFKLSTELFKKIEAGCLSEARPSEDDFHTEQDVNSIDTLVEKRKDLMAYLNGLKERYGTERGTSNSSVNTEQERASPIEQLNMVLLNKTIDKSKQTSSKPQKVETGYKSKPVRQTVGTGVKQITEKRKTLENLRMSDAEKINKTTPNMDSGRVFEKQMRILDQYKKDMKFSSNKKV